MAILWAVRRRMITPGAARLARPQNHPRLVLDPLSTYAAAMITALANPQRFLAFSRWAAPLLGALAAVLLAAGLWRAFAVPPDYQQGETVRILFVHVPAAEMSLFAYIGLAGASFFGLVFRHALADAAARAAAEDPDLGGRSLAVRRTSKFDHACNMAYVSAANANDDYLATLREHGVLTIGETPGFSRAGAIRLTTIGRQVRFEINQRNAAQAGAQLSSNLMRLAISVR